MGRHPNQQVKLAIFSELVVHFKSKPGRGFGRGGGMVRAFRQVAYQFQVVGGSPILLVLETTGDQVRHAFQWEDVDRLEATPAKVARTVPELVS